MKSKPPSLLQHCFFLKIVAFLVIMTSNSAVSSAQSPYHYSSDQTVNPANYISQMSTGDKLLMGNLPQFHLKYNVLWNGDSYILKGQSLQNGLSANLDFGFGEMERTLKYSLTLESRAEGGAYVVLTWEFSSKNGQIGGGSELLGYVTKGNPNTLSPMSTAHEGGQSQSTNLSTKATFVNQGSGRGHYETMVFWTQSSYPHPQNPYGMVVIATQITLTYWIPDPAVVDDCLHEWELSP